MTSYSEVTREDPLEVEFTFNWALKQPAERLLAQLLERIMQTTGAIGVPPLGQAWLLQVIVDGTGKYVARFGERPLKQLAADVGTSEERLGHELALLPGQGLVGTYIRGGEGYIELLSLRGHMEGARRARS